MSWLAICDHTERRLCLRGLGLDKQHRPLLADTPDTRMMQGTILFETAFSAEDDPQVLFAFKSASPTLRSLTFQSVPGGRIAMVQVQGAQITHASIPHHVSGHTDILRVTYAWDCTAAQAWLTVEQPDAATGETLHITDPQPLSLQDIRCLMLGHGDATFAPDMTFAALSDQPEPVGPRPTLSPATPLATPWGYRPAGELLRGDTVMTRSSGVVPVLHNVARSLPARGSFAPIRLRAPYFGLKQDVIVAPDQRLLIDGPEVEYLFSQEAVLVPARHLVNGFSALPEAHGPTIRYTQLLLPRHDTLLAAGTALESLYVGRLRRNPDALQASLFARTDRTTLPEHAQPSHQVLKRFEAIHLAHQRAA